MENSMNAPGKGLLKVSGILLIIFAAISILILVIGIVAAAALGSQLGAVVGGVAILTLILGLVASAFSLIMGIMGVKYADVPSKAQVCMVFAIIAIALQLVNLFTGSSFVMALIGLVLPVLYLIGALKNKQAAA